MTNLSIIIVLCAISLLLFKLVIYPTFLSPLARIPNAHFTSPISGLWILWARYHEREVSTIHRTHEKHGSVVRLGPNELSINCVEDGIRTIYVGGFNKHEFYSNLFANFGVHNMFSTTLSKPHSIRKRMLSHVYSKSNLQSSPTNAAVSRTVIYDRLLPILYDAATTRPKDVEIWSLLNSVTMDLVSGFIWGLRQGTNFLQDEKTAAWYLKAFQRRKDFVFWVGELPNVTSFLFKFLPFLIPKDVLEGSALLEEMFLKMCDRAEDVCTSGEEQLIEDVPVVFKQLRDAIANENGKPLRGSDEGDISRRSSQRLAVASELTDNAAAGQETSAITMTYLFWEIAQRHALQVKLREELLTLSPPIVYPSSRVSPQKLPLPKELDSLPLLHGILMETLRLHAAIPGSQPRVTPMNAAGTKLAECQNIPGDVRVSAQAFSLHRNAKIFPLPLEWLPERWLEDGGTSADQRAEMHRWFWAFGSGGRMCIGSNLAMQGIKLVVASIVTNFDVVIVDDEGIEQEDTYVAKPRGQKLSLRFQHVSNENIM